MFSGFHVKIRERISWDFGLRQKKLVLDQSFWTRIFSTGFFNEICWFLGSFLGCGGEKPTKKERYGRNGKLLGRCH